MDKKIKRKVIIGFLIAGIIIGILLTIIGFACFVDAESIGRNILTNFGINLSISCIVLIITDVIVGNKLDNVEKQSFSNNMLTSSNQLNTTIESLLNNNEPKNIKIICYGTGGFGGLIPKILRKDVVKRLEVVIPSINVAEQVAKSFDENFNQETSDFEAEIAKWNKLHKDAGKKQHIIYNSNIIPTMRAIIIYNNKNVPIFCSLQPYLMQKKTEGRNLFTSNLNDGTFAIYCTENSTNINLITLSNYVEDEFNRLIADSNKQEYKF